MKTRWGYLPQVEECSSISEQILLGRGFLPEEVEAFTNTDYSTGLNDPFLLSGMKTAVKRIMQARKNKENVVIYGDYDIDGITASALLYDFFTRIGLNVETYIPDRFSEGYGINKSALQTLKDKGANLVITVDCGVNSVAEAEHAKKIDLDLIITDHHEPIGKKPSALAVINPKLPGQKYPFNELAGVGVAFALVRAIISLHQDLVPEGQEKWLLDLVALGTICDVVPLINENRILARYGLMVAQKGRRPGFRALAKVSGTDLSKVSETDFGFRFGPRLNAAGRIDHARVGLATLLAETDAEADEGAQKLQLLNTERQSTTADILASATKKARAHRQDCILVLSDPDWSHGTVGIVASNLSEKLRKPTILLQELGETAKGSARSLGKFSIIEAIESAGEYLDKFGGHHFAAGITLPTENIAAFRHAINQYGMKNLNVEDILKTYTIDAVLSPNKINKESYNEVRLLAPYGNAHPQPLFASKLEVFSLRPIGKDLNHLKLQLRGDNKIFSAIAFSKATAWKELKVGEMYEFAYYLNENEWQGVSEIQLELLDVIITTDNVKEQK